MAEGEFRPLGAIQVRGGEAGAGPEFVDAEVLRLLRRRSLAALRAEVEPVEKQALARFLPAWNGIGLLRGSDALRGTDGLLRAVEQLAGALIPASALESLVLPARIPGYLPAMLDELTTAGDVLWTGHGSLAGDDGWIALHLADTAPLTIPLPESDAVVPSGELHRAIIDVLGGGGAFFFRPLADAVAAIVVNGSVAGGSAGPVQADDASIADALWDLVFAGLVSSDTLAPLRARLIGGRTTHRSRTPPPRARMRSPSGLALLSSGRYRGRPAGDASTGIRRTVPPSVVGRWSLAPVPRPTRRCGRTPPPRCCWIGTASSPAARWSRRAPWVGSPGCTGCCPRWRRPVGSAAGTSSRASGRRSSRRPVPWIGCARSRSRPGEDRQAPVGLVLAAADPANPYGAALPWPGAAGKSDVLRADDEPAGTAGPADRHRPARRAGALTVLVDGEAALYAERGGRSLLSFTSDPVLLAAAAEALSERVRSGRIGSLTITKIDGAEALTSAGAVIEALTAAGFSMTPRGLRLRAPAR